MSVEKAKNNYLGIGGCGRMNCAQSVAYAFKERFGMEDLLVDTFKAYGGGRAPAGLCGAYYAVKTILEKHNKGRAAELEKYFIDQAGALECHNIKSLKKLSCVGCVEKCSEFLEKIN